MRIAPSILSADFAALGEAIARVEAAGVDQLHVDVMDGHFVPNLTIGPPVIESIRKRTRLPLDVHLMIEEPERWVETYVKAGADYLTIHAEVCPHLERALTLIREAGAKSGVALNPSTPPEGLQYVLDDLDLVLVMSVNPGFGGQTFIPRSVPKVREVRALLDRAGNRSAPVEIDGGIDVATAPAVVASGARILVAGSAVFHSGDPERATRDLKSAAARALDGLTPASR
jgi:ribulose-phosphate 3-epimerase